MKIIDCFTFFNELDMLYYRLATLYDTVDYFVLVESNRTFSGKPKPLYYNDNLERFAQFSDKIVYIVDTELSDNVDDRWANEAHQRNSINTGIELLRLQDDDIIIITDLDEIPDRNVLSDLKSSGRQFDLLTMEQDFYYYNLTCRHLNKWCAGAIVTYRFYRNNLHSKPQECRDYTSTHQTNTIKKCGWHLSYFGSVETIRHKLQSFSHQEYNTDKYNNLDYITNQIKNSNDLFQRPNEQFARIPIERNDYLPHEYDKYLRMYIPGYQPYENFSNYTTY